MKATFAASLALASLIAAPALAQDPSGDAESGAALFERQCITCHVVVNDEGETLAGRNARTGPNLWEIAGRTAGTVDGFRYSNGLEALNEMGVQWTEENFVGYVQDPTPWIRETADSNRLRGSMTWKVRSEEEAHDLYAYLYSLAPPEGEGS
ncbi:cytochrome C [Rhodovulum sp. 12E13]|uniref:c-type cytochrome n=1 Tax=Rhodovulum sp. 12E13 TaxID=2203891 RepID=UPI000E15CC06|nr:c-type cytochrome [Rhodovulum sp. 12E13]RDC74091.1 cytochrome C [Rhodovulum sp. 12E13]